MTTLELSPFRVEVSAAEITDLRERLARTRWPEQIPDSGWDCGTDLTALRSLCEHWRTQYDWNGYAERLNAHPQFRTEIDGLQLHFYHLRSPEPDAKPLLLTHGWPGSVVEFLDVLGPLSNPRAHGGDPRDAFHLVVPSLPGYGYAGPTQRSGVNGDCIAAAFNQLMLGLGYQRYFAQGGDWGSLVTTLLAIQYPEQVTAIHLNLVNAPPLDPKNPQAGLTPAELVGLQRTNDFVENGSGYQQIQRTKPLSLAYGLTDSPAGLAGWLLEKFHGWSGRDEQGQSLISTERLLDNLSLYWLTGTIHSSMRLYYEHIGPGRRKPVGVVGVPTGHARFPDEIVQIPRAWAAARYNLQHWREMPRGGHFAAMEVPASFTEELRSYFRSYR